MKRTQHLPRRTTLRLEALEDRTVPSALPVATPLTQPDAATQAHASAAYGQLPLSFEANQGQTDNSVNFLSRGSGYTLFLTPNEAVLSLKQASNGTATSPRSGTVRTTSRGRNGRWRRRGFCTSKAARRC